MKFTVLAAVLALSASAQTAPHTVPRKHSPNTAASNSPKIVYRWDVQKSGVDDDLAGVSFVNRMVGYAVGKANTVLKTTDGGNTWTRLMERKDGVNFLRAEFTSPSDGWVDSEQGPLLHTSDGGESWQPATPLPGFEGFGPCSILGKARLQLHVPTTGDKVFRSDDAGRTWKALGQLPRNDYEAIFFVDDHHGWVAGDYGRLARTADGGATWQPLPLPIRANLTQIQFVSPETGWLLPQRGHQGGLLATTDGGATWNTQYAGLQTYRSLTDMQFLNAQAGFLLAEGDRAQLVLETSNGGKKWQTIGKIKQYSRAISFPAADEGWAVGPGGYIVHYHKVVLQSPPS